MKGLKIKLWAILVFFFLITGCQKDENERTYLFNGTDLVGWDTWLGTPFSEQEVPDLARNGDRYTEQFGLNNDPLDVFSVVQEEGEPVIKISGYLWGGIITQEEFNNYHLHLEFKWGNEKHIPRKNLPKSSGVCYHSKGEYGSGFSYWMRSCKYDLTENEVGNFERIGGISASVPATYDTLQPESEYKYNPDGEMIDISISPFYVSAIGNFENPEGQWNTVDIYTMDSSSVHMLNDEVVVAAYHIREYVDMEFRNLTSGKIQLQSEGAEIFYKNIWIEPMDELPEFSGGVKLD